MPSTPMTGTDTHNGVARQAPAATQRSVETWMQGAQALTVPVDLMSKLPTVDLTRPVEQYFQYVQTVVDLNRDLATTWAELVMSLTGVVREHAETVSHIVQDQTESVADLAREQVEKTEQAEKEQARKTRQAEREQAKQTREQARERYDGLTKAELSDDLAERELPKTGTVEKLIERLVGADSE
jgi:hypothetical protein